MNLLEQQEQTNYKRIYVPGKGMVLEHRHVMEQLLGRPLLQVEEVHHKDKNRSNNKPDNLELCPDSKTHKEQHSYGKNMLLEFLIMYNNEYGHFPTYRECAEHLSMPHPSTFAREFGSWRNAKQKAQRELDRQNEEWDYVYDNN